MLKNIKQLKEDMALKQWTICSFLFKYKNIDYIVLVKRFVGLEKRISDYALVKLHFMDAQDLSRDYEIEANSTSLLINDVKEFRLYFKIEYSQNLGDIIRQFTEKLSRDIPSCMPENLTNIERQALIRSLNISDSENPDKIYCKGIRRNPDGQHRSDFNSDKTRLLRPLLFEKFINDLSISFCYSINFNDEKTDAEILYNFSKNG